MKFNFTMGVLAFVVVCLVISFAMYLAYKTYQVPSKPTVVTEAHEKLVCPTPIIKVYNKNTCPVTLVKEKASEPTPDEPLWPEAMKAEEFPRILGRITR